LGLFGRRSYEKFVPEAVFRAPNDQVALFLRHLWATDGSVRWEHVAGQAKIYYASTSHRLVDDVAQLLLRIGICSRIMRARKVGYRDCWQLWIDRAENQKKFLHDVGVYGARGRLAEGVLAELEARTGRPGGDTIPKEVWDTIAKALSANKVTHRKLSRSMRSSFAEATRRFAPGRSRLHIVAALLDDRELHTLATGDVIWDRIVEIVSIGERDVYDGTVSGTHNFVVNGITAHNSLEQDADMVILLHRPDAFDRDDPRGGEADFILAKHRNGPTKTVTVAHQLHLSRFANMAR
jgi:replicative DNA helicase